MALVIKQEDVLSLLHEVWNPTAYGDGYDVRIDDVEGTNPRMSTLSTSRMVNHFYR